MSRYKRLTALLWLAIISLAACTEHAPVPPPEVKLNPAPKEVYEITITMEDAPASLEGFTGQVQYTINNYLKCVPVDYTMAIGGIRREFAREVAIEFRRVESRTFKAEWVDDMWLNEDYYGHGMCKWKASGVSTKLNRQNSTFSRMGVSTVRLLRPGHIEQRYCLKDEHIREDILGACPAIEGLQSRKEPTEWFYKVTMEAKRK